MVIFVPFVPQVFLVPLQKLWIINLPNFYMNLSWSMWIRLQIAILRLTRYNLTHIKMLSLWITNLVFFSLISTFYCLKMHQMLVVWKLTPPTPSWWCDHWSAPPLAGGVITEVSSQLVVWSLKCPPSLWCGHWSAPPSWWCDHCSIPQLVVCSLKCPPSLWCDQCSVLPACGVVTVVSSQLVVWSL